MVVHLFQSQLAAPKFDICIEIPRCTVLTYAPANVIQPEYRSSTVQHSSQLLTNIQTQKYPIQHICHLSQIISCPFIIISQIGQLMNAID